MIKLFIRGDKMLKSDESITMSMNYAEYAVTVKKEGKLLLKSVLLKLFTLLLFVAGTWFVCGGVVYMPPLEIIIIGFCAVFYFLASSRLKIEYEYIVTSGMIEFDAIYNQRKRKEIATFSLSDAERIAPYNDSTKSYIQSKNIESVYDFCSSSASKRRYFILLRIDGNYVLVYFDAISKTLDVMKFYKGSLVEIDKEIYYM